MKTLIIALFFISAPTSFVHAQDAYHHDFSFKRSTGNSGTGANLDMKYYRCEWTIDPRTTSKTITGKVTVHFKTTDANVKDITIDLNEGSFNNSSLIVKYHGTNCTTSFTGNILNITLPSAISANGTLDSVEINYSGIPPAVNEDAQGYQRSTDGDGINYINTLSESYEDRDWWPCKADMQDKPDSMDLIVTVPWASSGKDTFWVAANGVLVSSPISAGWRTFTFKTRYPTASYLVGISVARFNRYYRTVNISGTIVPVEYDLLAGKTNSYYTNAVNAMDKINQVIIALSEKFGDYPFKNEKHGFYDGLLGAGGMEHQTFSCINSRALTSLGTLTHELMHQWFGDKVSFATWNDLWLAEGFARYSEGLGPELLPSVFGTNPVTIRSGWKSSAQNNGVSAWIPNSNIGTSNLIWNSGYGSSVYDRGAMVVSMLRTLLGDDKFFQACRNYLDDPLLAYQSATTNDLQAHMEAVCDGYDFSGFFNSFVYGNGHPDYNDGYSIKWWPVETDKIIFEISGQTQINNPNYFSTPIPLRVQGPGGKDTVIVLFDEGSKGVSVGGNGIVTGNSKTPKVYLGFTPTSVDFDPYNQSLASGTTTKASIVAVTISGFSVKNTNNGNKAILNLTDEKLASSVSLERSNDGTTFSSVGKMQSAGNGVYSFTDTNANNNTVYYRAKIVTISSEILYSDIVKIPGNNYTNHFQILQNPVSNKIRIRIPSTEAGAPVHFVVFDLKGRKMIDMQKKVSAGITEIDCNLPTGSYLLKVQGKGRSETLKFLKK